MRFACNIYYIFEWVIPAIFKAIIQYIDMQPQQAKVLSKPYTCIYQWYT